MGWNNPPISWPRLEAVLSGASGEPAPPPGPRGPAVTAAPGVPIGTPAAAVAEPEAVPYVELHAHSAFSFLDGVDLPEELVAEAQRLRLTGLALTDHNGFAGAARFAEAAGDSLMTVYGTEVTLARQRRPAGDPDPAEQHLLLLARGREGYHRLSAAVTAANLAGDEKDVPRYRIDDLADRVRGHVAVLTGCRKSPVRSALTGDGRHAPGSAEVEAARQALSRLIARFGAEHVVVELHQHGAPLDDARNDALAMLATELHLPVVATGNIHYARPASRRLAEAAAAIRSHRSIRELDPWRPATGGAFLRSGAEMARRFARYPGAVPHTVTLARELAFSLATAKPELPDAPVPEGHTPDTWLRHCVLTGLDRRADRLDAATIPRMRERIEHELDLIADKHFAGYFLIVADIVRFARSQGILCQGRGSAAASLVCYLLDITAIDPVFYQLPFERFISVIREEEPDIDVDFESDRREEVIQYVFELYGRDRAAQVCNTIQYRPRNAVRDAAKALGYAPGQQDVWSKSMERWGTLEDPQGIVPTEVMTIAEGLMTRPRHRGIHSGGMVLTKRPVSEVVPVERARMPGRTVVQWDKDDCADMGLVKFDLLGLGMLAAVRRCFELVDRHLGEHLDLDAIPKEEQGVYDQLCRGDAVGVFQVESRAQLGLLPRLQPREFYHLAIEIALIRPGPIQGGAVHPYVRRKTGLEKPTYLHDKLRPVLERTLGVPVFQEQLMQIAVAIADFSPAEADMLRRAMGSKRGVERIDRLRSRLYEGMARNGVTGAQADGLYQAIQAFAGFGFAESHALSFALIVYASTWLRLHYPAAFLAALLASQPMGFYSAASLTADARRHGVEVLRPDLNRSQVEASLEARDGTPTAAATGRSRCRDPLQDPVGPFDPAAAPDFAEHRRDGNLAVRQSLGEIRGISAVTAQRIVHERDRGGPYTGPEQLVERTGLGTREVEALAAADAFACFGLTRTEALWRAGAAAEHRPEYVSGSVESVPVPLLPERSAFDQLVADLQATGLSPDDHPMSHARAAVHSRGALRISDLGGEQNERRIVVAGVVTHRQRPGTAGGITFLNLEDETGMLNVVCSPGLWKRHRALLRGGAALVVRGILQYSPQGVMSLNADHVVALDLLTVVRSRDFH